MVAHRQIRIYFLCLCARSRVFTMHRFDMRCASVFESISGIQTMNWMPLFRCCCHFFLLSVSRVVSCRVVHIDHVRVAVGIRYVQFSRSISTHIFLSPFAMVLNFSIPFWITTTKVLRQFIPQLHIAQDTHTRKRFS